MTDAAAAAHDDHHEVNYIAKFWWLLGLTIAEVGVAIVLRESEGIKLFGLSFFAFWKAAIVMNSFMHLKDEPRALKLGLLFPAFLIIVLFTLFMLDANFLNYANFEF